MSDPSTGERLALPPEEPNNNSRSRRGWSRLHAYTRVLWRRYGRYLAFSAAMLSAWIAIHTYLMSQEEHTWNRDQRRDSDQVATSHVLAQSSTALHALACVSKRPFTEERESEYFALTKLSSRHLDMAWSGLVEATDTMPAEFSGLIRAMTPIVTSFVAKIEAAVPASEPGNPYRAIGDAQELSDGIRRLSSDLGVKLLSAVRASYGQEVRERLGHGPVQQNSWQEIVTNAN